MNEEFARSSLLIGESRLHLLENTHVAIFGIGGVGSYVAEALGRMGVGILTLVDGDVVARNNINRQIIALQSTIGQSKVQVMKERLKDINPKVQVFTHKEFFKEETKEDLPFEQYDYVVDAIDMVPSKVSLAKVCRERVIPFIASMGTGNKLDPTAFKIAKIEETSICPLAKVMRKKCKEEGIQGIKVLFSTEPPRKQKLTGSVPYVPSVGGLIIASEVIKDLIEVKEKQMKNILITGGPTNEYIDEVMKITNMSTGSLSKNLAKIFLNEGYQVTLIINSGVDVHQLPKDDHLFIVSVETTDEMMAAIFEASKEKKYDGVIHAAAVGDYKGDFTFLMEDLAEEIFQKKDTFTSSKEVLELLENPDSKIDNSSKISSYQKNLTVKLALTPKIIANLRNWFPSSYLCGCKLLEDVSQEELFDVASKLCKKNKMDIILANDLAQLRKGNTTRFPINQKGELERELETPEDIFKFIHQRIGEAHE